MRNLVLKFIFHLFPPHITPNSYNLQESQVQPADPIYLICLSVVNRGDWRNKCKNIYNDDYLSKKRSV